MAGIRGSLVALAQTVGFGNPRDLHAGLAIHPIGKHQRHNKKKPPGAPSPTRAPDGFSELHVSDYLANPHPRLFDLQ